MLTEPVVCSTCQAVSINGGTLHCHACFAEQVPEGWQLVPKEPTVAMIEAYRGALKDMIEGLPKEQRSQRHAIREPFKCLGRWRAMLRAAPKP